MMKKYNALSLILDHLMVCYRMYLPEQIDKAIIKVYREMYKLFGDI